MSAPVASRAGLQSAWGRTVLLLTPALLLAVLTNLDAWRAMVTVWSTTTTYHHGFTILPITLLLVWLRRDALAALHPRPEPLALVLVLGFGLLGVLARAAEIQLFINTAAVGIVVATVVALLGREVARVLWFPLLFAFFMVPFGDVFVPPLQVLTAEVAVFFLRQLGIPVFHDGILITIPTGIFEVAEACAGIRFLIANVVIATLFAYLALDRPWKWVVFLFLGIVVPVVANTIRAFGIIMIAHWTDSRYAVGVDHIVYGWGFFTAIMLLILWLGTWMADRPVGVFAAAEATPPPPAQRTRTLATAIGGVFGLLLLFPAYTSTVMAPPPLPQTLTLPQPITTNGWQPDGSSSWRPEIVGADALRVDRFAKDGSVVDLAIAYFAFERPGAKVVFQLHRLVPEGYGEPMRWGTRRLTLGDETVIARFQILPKGRERRIVLWWYWIDQVFTSDVLEAKLLTARTRLVGSHDPAAIIAFSTSIEDDEEEAFATLEAFARDALAMRPLLYAAAHN